MDKLIIHTAGVAEALDGPNRIIPIDLDSPRSIDALEKYASEGGIGPDGQPACRGLHPEVKTWLDGYEPRDDHVAFLIDALGSDAYGENVNADIFPADHLGHPGRDYGYKTFEIYAFPYFHHINKGERFAYGPKVSLATWLPDMERVQLIAWWSRERCGDMVPRLLNGELLDVSMGCRVPYDQCTYCGKKARKRSEYCDHLKFMMRRLMPNGIRVGALNYFPKFFDISFVRRGAEKCSKFLMPIGVPFSKVASMPNPEIDLPEEYRRMSSAELWEKVAGVMKGASEVVGGGAIPQHISPAISESDNSPGYAVDEGTKIWQGLFQDKKAADKEAAVDKAADIDKEVPSNLNISEEDCGCAEKALEGMRRMRQGEHDIPSDTLDELAGSHPLKQLLSTLMGARIMPKPKEFQRIILVSMGHKPLADKMEQDGEVFDEHADVSDEDMAPYRSQCDFGPRDFSEDIFKKLAPLMEARSFYKEPLARRSIVIIKRAAMGEMPIYEEENRRKVPLGALALGLAAFHGAFRAKATPEGIAQIGQAAKKNPAVLALLTALGVAAVEASRQISLTNSHPFTGGVVHTAAAAPYAGPGLATRAIGGPAALYAYSDFQEAKRRRGEQMNRVQQFIWRHPDVASMMFFFGAPTAARGLARVGGGVKSLFKGASPLSDLASALGSNAVAYGMWQKKALPLAFTGAAADTLIAHALLSGLNSNEEQGSMSPVAGVRSPR